MSLADRIGDWSLNHPVTVLTTFAFVGGFALGFNAGGVAGAAMGAVMALVLSAAIATVEPHEPALGPHE